MLEAAEVGARVSRETWDAEVPGLRVDLINAQTDLLAADFPVLLLLAGSDRDGTRAVLARLHEWMDTRMIATHAFGPPNEVERGFPRFWRYWRVLPRRGQLGLFYGAWAQHAVAERVLGALDDEAFLARCEAIRRFERTQVEDGALLVKLWIHLPRQELLERLVEAETRPDDWRTDEVDWRIVRHFDALVPQAERFLHETHTGAAPWHVIEGTDERHRDLVAARRLLEAIEARLRGRPASGPAPEAPGADRPRRSALSTVDLSRALAYDDYKERLGTLQAKLQRRAVRARRAGVATAVVFEGWDAAGKGGAIRRVVRPLDPRDYRVVAVSAPTEEERTHHYLWRFWRQLPAPGELAIFDRSWYGRVLVERVEGLARPEDWRRAYEEINAFEAGLVEHGIRLAKFWLHIDRDEQKKRFRKREKTPYKKYKISDEDYRNRQRWDDYRAAVGEMVERTDTERAPWQLVAANDKRWARVRVLETLCALLEEAD